MGVMICDECVDEYFPLLKKANGMIWGGKCSKCEADGVHKIFFGLDIEQFLKEEYPKMKEENETNNHK